ncbi:unnamed protein product [Allacma fusca]|uniref:NADP-dependent oxidoreductase domain-containing protein n=1 Tax=Allacma fusca TaxID=39272 RepID=A0A8J2LSE7_9HEXA|nr:unnamed protein product [Allacma fusca]
MPLVGLGSWLSTEPELLEKAVDEALEAGYRHIDTAYNYKNEHVIGNVLKRWLDQGKIKREDIFITTKLPQIGMRPEKVEYFLRKSLFKLQLDFVNLYLVHLPFGCNYLDDETLWPTKENGEIDFDATTDLVSIWKSMEEQVDAGLTRSVGISNFNCEQIERICKNSRIQPANLQVELHVYFQQKELRQTCQSHGITVCAYGAFGSPGRKEFYKTIGMEFDSPDLLSDPVVSEIATNHGKTSAQILLRFLVQQNIVVIPKSLTPERIRANLQVFDFELTTDDVQQLEKLDRGIAGRTFLLNNYKGVTELPEYPFKNELPTVS